MSHKYVLTMIRSMPMIMLMTLLLAMLQITSLCVNYPDYVSYYDITFLIILITIILKPMPKLILMTTSGLACCICDIAHSVPTNY